MTVFNFGSQPQVIKIKNSADFKKALKAKGPYWIDFDRPSKEETKYLSEVFGFHQLSIEDCFDEVHYPKLEQFAKYLFVIVHTLEASNKRRPTAEVDFFIADKYLVTVHQRPSQVLETARQHLAAGAISWAQTPAMLFQALASRYVDEYFPMLDELDDEIDHMEDEVFKLNKGGEIQSGILINQFLLTKKKIVTLRRLLTPQRDIFSRLARGEFSQIAPEVSVYFRDVYDRLFRITEMLDSFRDVLSSTLEAHLSVVSNRLNEVMKVLTIVTVILLPLTVITGIYGMNFRYMPELYHPMGYPWALMLMLTIGLSLVWYFKHRRWL